MDAETLMGLIMMAVIGPAIGNYATSVVYRLPFGQTPFEKHPYCGSCNTMLQPKDLFPIWSYVFLRGRCRYCGVKIPPVHTIVEVASGVLFIVNFLVFGFGEAFLLITGLGMFMIILAGLEHTQTRLYPLILTFCFFLAAMTRLLADGSIYPMVESGFICFFIVTALWRLSLSLRSGKSEFNPEDTGYRVPNAAMFAGLIGIALPLPEAFLAMGIGLILYALQRAIWGWNMQSAAAGLGMWVGMLGLY